jgi:CP family cyanate transporter-like MFS transporter
MVTLALAPSPQAQPAAAVPHWWPNWKEPLLWRIGFILASVNSVYFGTNTFLPGLLTQAGHSDLISGALTALNFWQLPASFLMVVAAHWIERRVWPYVAVGCLILLTLVAVVMSAGDWTAWWAGALGFWFGIALPLCLALPPLLVPPAELARVSAAMFTISYAVAMAISVLAGAVWDVTGLTAFAFLPIGAALLPLILLTPAIRFPRD